MATLRETANVILSTVFGSSKPACEGEQLQADVVCQINAALQRLHSAGESFVGRLYSDITLVSGQADYPLPDTLQEVLPPIVHKSNNEPLTPLTNLTQYANFGALACGQTTHGSPTGKPLAYFVDITWQDAADSTVSTLKVTPVPTDDEAGDLIQVPYLRTAPRMSTDDWDDVIPVTHEYVCSIVIPIASYLLSKHRSAKNPEAIPAFEQEYNEALIQLGQVDPTHRESKERHKPVNAQGHLGRRAS